MIDNISPDLIPLSSSAVDLEIIFQDDYMVAVNKPAGMLVHRSWLDSQETRFVMQTLRDQISQYVYPIHRLDRPTSGVLLFALNPDIAQQLCQQFEQKQVEKSYLAVVRGYLQGQERIDYPLKVKQDKIADKFADKEKLPQSAITDYIGLKTAEMPYPLGRYQTSRYSLVRLLPKTGRKHQLRRHMKHIFHPILGDTQYGDLHQNRLFQQKTGSHRLMLHAESLQITHPITQQKLRLTADLDQQWEQVFRCLGFSE
ncbi:tRNA pseudouridine(65) synthase TruC [Volucribacter amazonae]|uniref:tRNA pseudouridine synthase C n=1 Tax=Volucribacter amazonae TaxID=256731 RepID=A0A9X4PB34_9PAST|nr:tRNA pseudouridine(65) synthase TruC [Volucribacter amazonae]MDG6894081.1 tRNA pseudouridine(65) synthase TruC [Volucribacter amazonae]